MKIVRAKLHYDLISHTLYVFDKADDAYMYSSEVYQSLNTNASSPVAKEITLIEDDFLEMEWIGCEYKYTKEKVVKINCYRIIKASDIHNELGMLVEPYEGWILDEDLPNRSLDHKYLTIDEIAKGYEMFNFVDMFGDIKITSDIDQ